ncbi:MAG: IS200/IS605 family transposase [Opitutales bacterium]|nr:IS200/IS605 family transposase [Opitutales bacterium]
MPQSLARILIHVVFSTKNRESYLVERVRPAFHAYLSTTLKNIKCPALALNSVHDHVHFLIILHRTMTVAKVVEEAKKSSSKWLKTQDPLLNSFSWQTGYGAFSVSESNCQTVREYIQNQAEHHRKVSFQEEYRAFLTKHGISFDERYVWD